MTKTWWLVVGVVVVVGWYFGLTYNRLVGAGVAVDTQWAQVDTVLQRRFDLIPNVVGAVKGILNQEQKVFGDLAEARTRYAGATSVGDKVAAANDFQGALGRLLVVMENYPQLRSVEAVNSLIVELEGSENRISVERGRYNNLVGNYNLLTKTFPSAMVASLFNFQTKQFFQAEVAAKTAPQVDLTNQ